MSGMKYVKIRIGWIDEKIPLDTDIAPADLLKTKAVRKGIAHLAVEIGGVKAWSHAFRLVRIIKRVAFFARRYDGRIEVHTNSAEYGPGFTAVHDAPFLFRETHLDLGVLLRAIVNDQVDWCAQVYTSASSSSAHTIFFLPVQHGGPHAVWADAPRADVLAKRMHKNFPYGKPVSEPEVGDEAEAHPANGGHEKSPGTTPGEGNGTMRVIITDINPTLVEATKAAFTGYDGVEARQESILEVVDREKPDAVITPTNARGNMSGGVDGLMREFYSEQGFNVQTAVHAAIKELFGAKGVIPIGRAAIVQTSGFNPGILISTPTMVGETDDIRRTKNTAYAIAAAFQAIHGVNKLIDEAGMGGDPTAPKHIDTVVMPGLGTGTGKMDPSTAAELMRTGWELFRRGHFPTWADLDIKLREVLSESAIPAVSALAAEPMPEPTV